VLDERHRQPGSDSRHFEHREQPVRGEFLMLGYEAPPLGRPGLPSVAPLPTPATAA